MKKNLVTSAILTPLALLTVACGSGLPVSGTTLLSTTPTSTTTTTTRTFKYTYVTANMASGNFQTLGAGATGIEGADNLCESDASYPGTGTYKAFLVDGVNRVACTTANCGGGIGEHTDWVLAPNTEYRRINGKTTIGTTNALGLFTFPLDNQIVAANVDLWTGFNTTQDYLTNATTCTLFSTSAGGTQAGITGTTGSGVLACGGIPCNHRATAAPPPPHP